MIFQLRKNHKAILTQWANGDDLRIGRRAKLVLDSSTGVTTKQLQQGLPMTEQRVMEVIDRYRESGLMGLIESPRSGRSKKIPSATVVNLAIDEMRDNNKGELLIDELTLKIKQDNHLNISKDTVWRQARLASISFKRNRKRHLKLNDQNKKLLGLVITPNVKIIAVLRNQKFTLALPGYLEITCDSLRMLHSESIESLYVAFELMQNQVNTRFSKRAKDEAITRWVSNVSINAQRKTGILDLFIEGNYLSDEMHQWLKALKRFKLTDGVGGFAGEINFCVTQSEWASTLNGLNETLPKNQKYADLIWAKMSDISSIQSEGA